MSPFSTLQRIVLSAVILLIVTGCTNSKLVIGPLYNRLDDQIRGEFHKLAKWDKNQIAHFEARVGTFHVWHRQNELPQYATLLNTIQASIKTRDVTTREDIKNWIDTAESYTHVASMCHPVNFSYDLMQTLTDEQIDYIEKRFKSERKKNFTRYLESTPEERRKKRLENVVKWSGRIGLDFNNTQKRMLEDTLSKQVSLRQQYYALVDVWAKDVFILARMQDTPDYQAKMKVQMNKLWGLLENAHNDEWKANRKLWRDFGYEFVKSLSHDQRIQASNWIDKMGSTVRDISKDEPSFKVTDNPELGCIVGQPVNG